MRMLVVYYMKCVLDKAFTIIVKYDDLGLLHYDGGNILHKVCISRVLEYYSNV